MTIEHLIAFNFMLLAAMLSPGPAMLVCIKNSLISGRNAGMATGLGLGLMAATWTGMALLGLDVIFRLFPWAYAIIRTVGALYLIYLAWNMWKSAADKLEFDHKPTQYAFGQGILVNLLNPKTVFFAAAVLLVIFPQNMSPVENVIIILNQFVAEAVLYSTLAVAMSSNSVSNRYLGLKKYLDRCAAVVLGGLGLRILFGRD